MNPTWKKAVSLAALVTTLGLGVACGSSDDPSVNAATNETVKRATTSSTEKSTATTEKEAGADHDDHDAAKSTTTKAAGDDHDGHDTATTDATPKPIIIKTFKYQDLTAKAGVETVVDNKDDAPHTLTAKDESFDTGTINAKEKGKLTVAKAGTYDIYCVIHPSMKAKLKVT